MKSVLMAQSQGWHSALLPSCLSGAPKTEFRFAWCCLGWGEVGKGTPSGEAAAN